MSRNTAPAHAFFEGFFELRVLHHALFTGYYEPLIAARRQPGGPFTVPFHRRPDGFVRCAPQRDLPGDGTYARQLSDGSLPPLPTRGEVSAGALDGEGLEIAYAADPVDVFFAHVQGSATLVFEDGSRQRIGYHGKSGHPYTAIGKTLIMMGLLSPQTVSMASIRGVLATNPAIVEPVLASNASYIFFREREDGVSGPVAAGGVPLQAMRSIAVDRDVWGLGTPMFAAFDLPDGTRFAQTVIAEDCGSAILGPARGDLFCGTGTEAGDIAGAMNARGTLAGFVPSGSPL